MTEKSSKPLIFATISGLGSMLYVPTVIKELNYHGPENYSFFIAFLFGCPLFLLQLVLAGLLVSFKAEPVYGLNYWLRLLAFLLPALTLVMLILGISR